MDMPGCQLRITLNQGGFIMAYYTVCPACGANLDPGEKCNCIDARVKRDEFFSKHIETEKASGQLNFIFSNDSGGTKYSKC